MFSRTVIDPKVAVIWKVRPTPSRQTCRGLKPAMLRPPMRIAPESGSICPSSRLKQVVLPAPFGPIIATSSPAATLNETPRTACTPP